jgi:hypothetical protein
LEANVVSPLDGTVVALSDVPDPVFGKGIMGPCVAIEPSGNNTCTQRQFPPHP